MAGKKTKMSNEDKEREARTKEYLTEQSKASFRLKGKEAEFLGIEREFLYHQEDLLSKYNQSKDVKHPRDVGDIRENYLRDFLLKAGYVPAKYEVSTKRIRVASTSGHISPEMDIVLYDKLNGVSLMNRGDVYEVLPVESVYGVIQVKSKLTKQEIKSGLSNIAAFKKLKRKNTSQFSITMGGVPKADTGFGILFAYDSDMEWIDIVNEVEAFAKGKDSKTWCNCVVILGKGIILYSNERGGVYLNSHIDAIKEVKMFGMPDRQSICLYQFYEMLMNLLKSTNLQEVNVGNYFDLPMTAGDLSYRHCFGHFSEMGVCKEHGAYLRKLSEEALLQIIEVCKEVQPINRIRALDIAYGNPENPEAYARQPQEMRIYNPDNLDLKDILLMDSTFQGKTVKSLAYDTIECEGMIICIPYHYWAKEQLFTVCPKCLKKAMGNAKKKKQ